LTVDPCRPGEREEPEQQHHNGYRYGQTHYRSTRGRS
jgi:hypothetical protein